MQKKTPFYKRNNFKKPEELHRINEKITAKELRLAGDNVEPGVYPLYKALELAEQLGLDLVEISDKSTPPVAKIIDYRKFIFEKKKRDKEIKSKSQKVSIKEIRFTSNTDEHDVDFKSKHAEKFLKEGSKVRCFVLFKGRDIVFKDRANLLLLNFAQKLEDIANVESMPKLDGRKMFMTLVPKVKKKQN